jgi:hypothetical protein
MQLVTSLKRKNGKRWRTAIVAWIAPIGLITGTLGFNASIHIHVHAPATEITMVAHVDSKVHGEASASGGPGWADPRK